MDAIVRHAGVRRAVTILVLLLSIALPLRVAAEPFVYVADPGTRSLHKIDTATNRPVKVITPPGNAQPAAVASHPGGALVFVTLFDTGRLLALDVGTDATVFDIPVGTQPIGLAVSRDGARVYVANVGSPLTVVDITTSRVSTVPVTAGQAAVAVTPDGSRVYATHPSTGQVSVVDTATNTVVTTLNVGGAPTGVAAHPDGSRIFVTGSPGGLNSPILTIDTATNAVTSGPFSFKGGPAIVVHPDGTRAYVRNGPGSVGVLDLLTDTSIGVINVTGPDVLALDPFGRRLYISSEPLPGQSALAVADTLTNSLIPVDPATHQTAIPIGTDAFGVAVASVPAPIARVMINAASFGASDQLRVAVSVQSPVYLPAADVYVGVVLPGAQTAMLFAAPGVLGPVVSLATPSQFVPMQSLPSGGSLFLPSFLQFTFPSAGVPEGRYALVVVLARQGGFADNRIDPGDISTLGFGDIFAIDAVGFEFQGSRDPRDRRRPRD